MQICPLHLTVQRQAKVIRVIELHWTLWYLFDLKFMIVLFTRDAIAQGCPVVSCIRIPWEEWQLVLDFCTFWTESQSCPMLLPRADVFEEQQLDRVKLLVVHLHLVRRQISRKEVYTQIVTLKDRQSLWFQAKCVFIFNPISWCDDVMIAVAKGTACSYHTVDHHGSNGQLLQFVSVLSEELRN